MAHGHGNQIWRVFFIGSSRNERTLDGLGFLHVIAPLVGAWGGSAAERRDIAKRHVGYFNANPLLASSVVGVVAALEARRARGEGVTPERIERAKSALASVLTARGDHFFESLLVPLGLTIASISAMGNSYIGLAVFLVLYNVYHFRSRIGGYLTGVALGEGVGGEYVAHLFREERFLGELGAFGAGIFAALACTGARRAGGIDCAAAGAVITALAVVLMNRMSFMRRVAALFCAAALYLVVKGYVVEAIR